MNAFVSIGMSQTYVKECVFCNQRIRMSDQKGKWLPYELDGKTHDCKKNGKVKQESTTQSKKIPTKQNNNDLSLEVVLKKLASIGITIDLEKLRNCK
jgi:hypothetical protein